jgi:diguanylate cyclase (GGDEF)-like protein/PAS domain S-box-containing protein
MTLAQSKNCFFWPLLVLEAGLVVTAALIVRSGKWVDEQLVAQLDHEAWKLAAQLQLQFAAQKEALNGLVGIYAASNSTVNSVLYDHLVELAKYHLAIQEFRFAHRVTQAELPVWHRQVERSPAKVNKAVPDVRSEYLLVEYVYPIRPYPLRHDLLADPACQGAFERLKAGASMALCERLVSEYADTPHYCLMARLPATVNDPLPGVVCAIFVPGRLIDPLAREAKALDIALYDVSPMAVAGTTFAPIYASNALPPDARQAGRFQARLPLEVGDRQWTLVVTARPDRAMAWQYVLFPWVVGTGGVFVSLLGAASLCFLLRRQQATETHLSLTKADLERAQAAAEIGSWYIDREGRLIWSRQTYRIFGIPESEPLDYKRFLACVHPEDREAVDHAWQAALRGAPYCIQHRIVVDGAVRWVEERAELVFSADGHLEQAYGTVQDITERKLAEHRIEQLAFYDPLTGLPNRALFLDRLQQALASGKRHGQRLALLFLDLDRFKEINDTQGHAIGDRALVEAARRLQATVRGEETLARLGGDEFVVIAMGAGQSAAALIAERLQKALSEPLAINGRVFTLKASIGIAIFPEDGRTPEELLKHADIAMYRAKASGSGYCFYRPQMGAYLARKLEIARRLEAALAEGGLQLHYQPQVNLSNGRLAGAEALARWHDPEWGAVSPAEFIPIAEERGIIGTLGEWVLIEACRQVRRWQERQCPLPGRIAVNVAARQFEDDSFIDRVLRIARETGTAPSAIELELTESSMMRDPERAVEVTRALASAGFALAIDDFGTGYSSLAYLKRFPVHKLKIDISFVRDMLSDRSDHSIVSTIVAMGKSLQLTTLAEGVEQAAQAHALQALGCDEAQGYYFDPPQPAGVFAHRWLQGAGSDCRPPTEREAPGDGRQLLIKEA